MTYQTQISKGIQGWQATSEAVLGETPEGTRILKLRTSKSRGGLLNPKLMNPMLLPSNPS